MTAMLIVTMYFARPLEFIFCFIPKLPHFSAAIQIPPAHSPYTLTKKSIAVYISSDSYPLSIKNHTFPENKSTFTATIYPLPQMCFIQLIQFKLIYFFIQQMHNVQICVCLCLDLTDACGQIHRHFRHVHHAFCTILHG